MAEIMLKKLIVDKLMAGHKMKFAAEVKNSWDHGMVGAALSEWCRANPSSAAQMIERLRDQNSARLKIINDKMAVIEQLRWEDKREQQTANAVDSAPSDCTTASLKADKIMTRKEYFDLPLYHWHSVCWDYDGVGSVGIKYDGRSPPRS